MKLIECHNLKTSYTPSSNRPILNGIDLEIAQGEFVVLLGLNGAGKSTLLRSLVGLVPVLDGSVYINNRVMTNQTLPEIRQEIGMLFQGGGLIGQLSVLDNVLCGRLGKRKTTQTLFGFPPQDRFLAQELLAQFGLKSKIHQRTNQLSGGQQQRVAIARALIQSPQILLADEPITGLDVIASQQVMETLTQLNREQGLTIIAVLHDLGMAAKYADRAIVLDAGRIVYDGKPNNLPEKFVQEPAPKVDNLNKLDHLDQLRDKLNFQFQTEPPII
ncbi:phosphonate ABC transporter ATP-binding protein [Cylindrospermopsis raciborskii CENA303]|uniref:Phosphonate ABC transporter ATP-binding protein n=1 Tax=Cylindrospermopsis raciborskii CENA303 TaxID=1170769 RepID=A0A1X4GJX0_9CYAN|nr:phosphonate ABC transporter ATP-binding protein [Cylindrospermopsis raciborskii]OSO97428.1 phosphonate ABC transporter ATP-binding protein [Cylindrospermopsis raciborskii CENA303]